ncbi:hypothetical protein M1L60_02575 [Actinoplanes sp. TRM 88003]|uniref:Uncharacterized protein n=1 Tax=Paractinoplanes aksuensis TaxID=2939490 RepID=A0ABT1DF73_9ACTN|nr:hypothetical protein [Actinoplanes aksuensis]MCO8269472.1 hypothetical protein [Actinoplanes aksuensis]
MTDLSPGLAAAALADIDQASAAVRRHSRWAVRALTAYAIGTLIFFPAGGLLEGPVVSVAWGLFLVSVLAHVWPRRVVGRGVRRLYVVAAVVWTVLWVGLAVLGHAAFAGKAGYWLVAGVVVAGPMAVAAWRARS